MPAAGRDLPVPERQGPSTRLTPMAPGVLCCPDSARPDGCLESSSESEISVFGSACGNNAPVGERFCRICATDVSAAWALLPAVLPPAEGTIFPARTRGPTIASLACRLSVFAFPLSILAIILGHLSLWLKSARVRGPKRRRHRDHWTGLRLHWIGLFP